jgi:hypothetical protein
MNRILKTIITITCVIGAVLSAGVTAFILIDSDLTRTVFGEWLAAINVNIEIDKKYAHNLSIISEPMGQYYFLSPTTVVDDPDMPNIVMHAQLRASGFHRRIFLRFPEAKFPQTLEAIDNISVFIGNKFVYLAKDEIRQFDKKTEDGYVLINIPGLYYTKSIVIKDWINYYGEFNIALKVFCNFFFYPARFIITYMFLFALLFLYWENIRQVYSAFRKKSWVPAFLLVLIVLFGFCLRINGYLRHSGWSDELYSATITGNPGLPFTAAFIDPGNPPFYFLLLKFWFFIFGWSEQAGTMLSVLLGTLAIPVMYILVKNYFNKKTALLAAFFMAVSGFAITYSQEMRAYILKIFLAPLIALFFLRLLQKQSLPNLLLYVLLSICMANAHYYGVLFIMANFAFYLFYKCSYQQFKAKDFFLFLAGNILIALSFMPYFLYQLLIKQNNFERGYTIRADYILIFMIIAVFSVIGIKYRNKFKANQTLGAYQKTFILYAVSVPVLIFVLAFVISIFKPLIDYRYLQPVNFPFFVLIMVMFIFLFRKYKTNKYAALVFIWVFSFSLYDGKARIPGGGYEYYKESRAYISADIKAHPERKSAILDNTSHLARYYGEPDVPEYKSGSTADVVYVFNDIFCMHQESMYGELQEHGLDDANILKIIPSEKIFIFKKYMK